MPTPQAFCADIRRVEEEVQDITGTPFVVQNFSLLRRSSLSPGQICKGCHLLQAPTPDYETLQTQSEKKLSSTMNGHSQLDLPTNNSRNLKGHVATSSLLDLSAAKLARALGLQYLYGDVWGNARGSADCKEPASRMNGLTNLLTEHRHEI